LGVAGAIGGTIHDAEGAAGVTVASDGHPSPWIAYGDGRLRSSPVSFDQASKAVAEGKDEVDRAHFIGELEGASLTNPSEFDLLGAMARAQAEVEARFGPPFRAVERFVPRPVEERPAATSANAPRPEWRWGNLQPKFVAAVDDYVRPLASQLSDVVRDLSDVSEVLSDTVPVSGTVITVHPRRAVKQVIDELTAQLSRGAVEALAALIGDPASAQAPVRARGARAPTPAGPYPTPSDAGVPAGGGTPGPVYAPPRDAGVPLPAGVP
jgi:hypothetical protein